MRTDFRRFKKCRQRRFLFALLSFHQQEQNQLFSIGTKVYLFINSSGGAHVPGSVLSAGDTKMNETRGATSRVVKNRPHSGLLGQASWDLGLSFRTEGIAPKFLTGPVSAFHKTKVFRCWITDSPSI